MKKFILCICIAIGSLPIYAQLTLLHTFDNSTGFYGAKWKYVQYVTDDVAYFRQMDSTHIYYYEPQNFSIVKTLTVELNEGYELSSASELPVGLYKNDNNRYFVVYSTNTKNNISDNNWYILGIYKLSNNRLTMEEEIATAFQVIPSSIGYISQSGQTKTYFLVSVNNYVNNTRISEYRIYSFGGSYSATDEVQANNATMMPYPNPSGEEIHLTYEYLESVSSISIFDVSGRFITRIPVSSNTHEYILDVRNYPEGVYFYEVDGKTQSFMVKK